MVLNKKGIFFTSAVIIIISIFLLSYTLVSDVSERKTSKKRVSTLDNFIISIQEDLIRKSEISGFRIIFLLENNIIQSGEYIYDFDSSIDEIFFNGTLYGIPQDPILISGIIFSDIESDIQQNSEKIGVDVFLSNPSIKITQEDPWTLKINLSTNLFLEDSGGKTSWNKTLNSISYVSIEGFEDPVYIINTNGLIAKKIIKTPYEPLVEGLNTSNLSLHTINSYYLSSTEAPSFLDRLQGDVNSESIQGIESLVNLAELNSKGIPIKEKSIVDHIYFSSENPSLCTLNVSGIPTWFRMDEDHSFIYPVCL